MKLFAGYLIKILLLLAMTPAMVRMPEPINAEPQSRHWLASLHMTAWPAD